MEQYSGRTKLGSATGFFYEAGSSLFLVTNRHVVIDEDERQYPDTLRLRLHTEPNKLTENEQAEIPLYTNGIPAWLEHPSYRCDIALLKLDEKFRQKYRINAFSRNSLVPQNLVISLGDPLTVLGFPLGFYDSTQNLPIARGATLASPYPVPFQGEGYFIIEARLHQGTSGAPVLYLPRTMIRAREGLSVGASGNFLLGIHSGALSPPSSTEPFDLNTCWFAELIEDILAPLRPKPPEEGAKGSPGSPNSELRRDEGKNTASKDNPSK